MLVCTSLILILRVIRNVYFFTHNTITHVDCESNSSTLDLNDTIEEELLDFGGTASDADDVGEKAPATESQTLESECLYPGSKVGITEAVLMIFQFALKHHLSSKAFAEMLLLLRVLLPQNCQLPKSVHLLKRFFLQLFPDVKVTEHKYCSDCHLPIQSGTGCTNAYSGCATVKRFVTVPLGSQLKRMMEGIYMCMQLGQA